MNNYVDVIIPTFKRVSLTKRALDSVLNQTYPYYYIYIIEDGSLTFYNEVQKYKKQYSNIKYKALNKNKGPSFARNYGALLGNSEYIAFLDSDDAWHPSKLEKQINYFKEHLDIFWLHTNETWFKHDVELKQKKKHLKQGGLFIEKLIQRCLISPSSVIFKRNFWNNHARFNEALRVAEDYELWMRLNFKHKVGYLSEPLTIKYSGDWWQLSQKIEIDKYRVLALHLFFRKYSQDPSFKIIFSAWKKTILYKIQILQNGALKHQHLKKYQKYVLWEKVIHKITSIKT